MSDNHDVVYWLQERALRRCGATMEAVHTKTQEWLWADEITRLREENARLREALKPFLTKHPAGVNADDYDWLLVQPDDIRRAQAAIRERGSDG